MSRPLSVGVSPHLSALTGARFVAALAVMLCHFGWQADWPRWISAHGREAVAFFFVLSGFVLTYNYAGRAPADRSAYGQFLRARFARVYPVHLFVLLVLTAVMLWLHGVNPASRVPGATSADLLVSWLQNVLLVQSYINTPLAISSWNSAAWSVSCEATFYLCFPLILMRIERLSGLRTIAWAALGSWAVTIGTVWGASKGLHVLGGYDWMDLQSWTYCAPYLRIGEFVTGCLAGLWFVRGGGERCGSRAGRELAVWGGLLAAMTLAMLQNYGVLPLIATNGVIFAPFFAVAVVAIAAGPTSLGRLLSGRTIGQLGEASYSLYLVHAIPMTLFQWLSDGHISTPVALGAIASSVVVSLLLFQTVEDPCRRLLRTRRPKLAPTRTPVSPFEPALAVAA